MNDKEIEKNHAFVIKPYCIMINIKMIENFCIFNLKKNILRIQCKSHNWLSQSLPATNHQPQYT